MKKSIKSLWYGILLTISVVIAAENIPKKTNFYLYPDSSYQDGPLNPHIPFIAPEPGGVSGKHFDVEKKMRFPLSPLIDVSRMGNLTFSVRDNMRRIVKDIIILSDNKRALVFAILPASKNKLPTLVYKDISGKWPRTITSVTLKKKLSKNWTPVVISWNKNTVKINIAGDTAQLQLSQQVPSRYLEEFSWYIDDLTLTGNGQLKLDWDSGYAAKVTPKNGCNIVSARLFGFDTMISSKNPATREYPRVQIQNAGEQDKVVTLQFKLKSELGKKIKEWQQKISVPPHSSVMKKITFPVALKNDIYHLYVNGTGFNPSFNSEKHFMYIQRRNEPAGPNKFALHHFHTRALGDWPAPLPIGKVNRYNPWGYIVGPAWIKDWDGNNGLNPDTPPEQWNWQVETDISIKAGIETAVCLISQPLLDWQRTKVYEKRLMGKLAWGLRGGKTNAKKYRRFVREFAKRYKGKVHEYEVENEPNAPHGLLAEDYVPVLKAVYEEIKAVDPEAKVFGICGTGNFPGYMKKVFDHGGQQYLDGVSWHTYTSPRLPDDMGLYNFLAQAKKIIKKNDKPILLRNSETGTYTARRINIEEPVSPKKVREYIDANKEPFVSKQWWRYCLNEWDASRSLVTNVTYNFLSGIKDYTFFGWATAPSLAKKMKHASFIFSSTVDNRKIQTPNLHSLAAGVMTAQLEGMIPNTGRLINENGIKGGIFKKKNGGEIGVLWCPNGKKTVLIECADAKPEIVSIFGQAQKIVQISAKGKKYLQLEMTKLPVYVHTTIPGLNLVSPISDISSSRLPDILSPSLPPQKCYKVSYKITNYYDYTWNGTVKFESGQGARVAKRTIDFSLKSGDSVVINNTLLIPRDSENVRFIWGMNCQLPQGGKISFYEPIIAKPRIFVTRVPDDISFSGMLNRKMPILNINKPKQCHIGRSPKLASLQEEQYWKGPDELSGKVKIGYNKDGLMLLVQVKDNNAKLMGDKFSVNASCVELFFDFRRPDSGQGSAHYAKGVYQFLLRPVLQKGQKPGLKNYSEALGSIMKREVLEAGFSNSKNYWVGLKLPWSAMGQKKIPEIFTFGFDVAIDGTFADELKRKTQLILFGDVSNCRSADKFGQCIIDTRHKTSKLVVETQSQSNLCITPAPYKVSWKNNLFNQMKKLNVGTWGVNVVMLGDSMTALWRHSNYANGKKVLEKYRKIYKNLNPFSFGIPGDEPQNILWQITDGQILKNIYPKVITLMIGVNSLNRGKPPEHVAAGIKKIVETLRKLKPGSKILLLGIWPCWDAKHATRGKVIKTNEIISKLADDKYIYYMDLGKHFIDVNGEMNKELIRDGIHPTEKGYELWGKLMFPYISEMITKPKNK